MDICFSVYRGVSSKKEYMEEKKTVLITGGSGVIGTKLAEALLAKGYKVIAVDLYPPNIKHENLTFLQLDISTN